MTSIQWNLDIRASAPAGAVTNFPLGPLLWELEWQQSKRRARTRVEQSRHPEQAWWEAGSHKGWALTNRPREWVPRILILLSGYLGAGALVTHSFLAMLSAPCRPGTVLDGVLDTSPQGASRKGKNKCERRNPVAVGSQRKDTGPRLGGGGQQTFGKTETSVMIWRR